MIKIEHHASDCIPVVESEQSGRIYGILSMNDMIAEYNTTLEEWETSQFLLQSSENYDDVCRLYEHSY